MKIRRVVTGHTPDGKAAIASDTEVDATTVALLPGAEFHRLWGADTAPAFPDEGSPYPSVTYFPPLGGFRFGLFTVPPSTVTPVPPADLMAAVQEAEHVPVTAKAEKSLPARLMQTPPQSGTITAERRNEALDLTELVLSNGVKVILKSTDFKNDQIQMAAARFGGQSLAPEADKFNAAYASAVVGAMGLGDFTPLELQRVLAGKVVGVSAGLQDVTDSLVGTSSHDDLETFFQMLHLKFGAVRRDESLFKSFAIRFQDATQNAMAQPEAVYGDALQSTLYAQHPRVLLTPRPEDFAHIDLARMQSLYERRFASAKGFTFVFVGSFNVDEVKPLLATYLASLPTPDVPTRHRSTPP